MNNAWGLAMSPDGSYVMAGDGTCCFATTDVYVIKTSNNTISATLNTGGFTHRWLAFSLNHTLIHDTIYDPRSHPGVRHAFTPPIPASKCSRPAARECPGCACARVVHRG